MTPQNPAQPLKVLVVDDERATREGLCEIIPWSELGMQVVATAGDGAVAERLVLQHQPDIVITDVRMPRRDGIALATAIRRSHPDTEVLFISGYDDREYLMSAIELRVFGYVEKPVAIKDMTRTLEALGRAVRRRQTDQLLTRAHTVSFLLQSPPAAEIEEYFRLGGIEMPVDGGIVAMVVRFPAPVEHGVKDELHHRLAESPPGLLFGEFVEQELVIAGRGSDLRELPARIFALLGRAGIDRESCAIGLGPTMETPEDYAESFARARKAVTESFYRGWGAVYTFRDGRDRICSPEELLVDDVRDALESDGLKVAINALRRRGDLIRTRWATPEPVVRDYFARVISAARAVAGEKGLCDDSAPDSYEDHPAGHGATLSELVDESVATIESLFAEASEFGAIRRLVYEAMRYVRRCTATVPTLSEVATHLRVSGPHLSRTFRSQTGQRFTDFVRDVKVRQAEVLLKDVRLSISEIADELGYEDRRYFSRVFRSVTGITPTEYRETHL